MPTIHVPDIFKPALNRIASMSDAELQQVREALANLKPHLKPEVIVKTVADQGGVADLGEIVQTLTSLSITRLRVDVPLDKFVHDVSRSFQPKTEKSAIEERLKSLLSIEALVLSARAFDVQHEYEKVFRSARIITDVRPVFNAAGTEATGAMIVHNLNVAYFENNEFKEIIFALDDADVIALKKILERAEVKTNTLEKLIGKAGVPYLESKNGVT